MWVGFQLSDEKILIYGKTLLGPEYAEGAKSDLRKKVVGGYGITPGAYFRHIFRKYLPDPPPPWGIKISPKITRIYEIRHFWNFKSRK